MKFQPICAITVRHLSFLVLACLYSLAVWADGISNNAEGLNQDSHHQDIHELRVIGAYPEERGLGHTVTALPDGRIFVYGYYGYATSIDAVPLDPKLRGTDINSLNPVMWDPELRAWRRIANAPECEYLPYLHTATALNDGRILIAGGLCDIPRIPRQYKAMSLWNDKAGKWEDTPPLFDARIYHTATLLDDNSVMFVGGESDTRNNSNEEPALSSVELYRDGKVTQLPAMTTARAKHTSTRLTDGRVVIAGGLGVNGKSLSSIEIFDPKTQSWSDGPSLHTARHAHSTTLLSDGRLMIVGGIDAEWFATTAVEIFDPQSMLITESVSLPVPFRRLSTITLENNDVLVVGTGFEADGKFTSQIRKHTIKEQDQGRSYSLMLLWSSANKQWQISGHLLPGRLQDSQSYHLIHAPQNSNSVLVFNGKNVMQWSKIFQGSTSHPAFYDRDEAASVLLKDGRVMIIGGHLGSNPSGTTPFDLVEIYEPNTNRFTKTSSLNNPKFSPSAIVLDNGNVVSVDDKTMSQMLLSSESVHKEFDDNFAEEWNQETGLWRNIEELNLAVRNEGIVWSGLEGFGKLKNGNLVFIFYKEIKLSNGTYKYKYKAFIWNPATTSVEIKSIDTTIPRLSNVAVMPGGKVLITGGADYRKAWQPETWDSHTGVIETLPFPPGHSDDYFSDRCFVLKNGNLMYMNRSRTEYEMTAFSVSNDQGRHWRSLPDIPDSIWRSRSREVMELNDGTLITESYRLPPGASAWQPMQHFPQEKAQRIQLLSDKLLALSLTPPHAAYFNNDSMQWEMEPGYYVKLKKSPKPALLELSDGRVMVTGFLDKKQGPAEIFTQIWNPANDSWQPGEKLAGEYTQVMQSMLLPSGRVLHLGIVRDGNLKCEIGHPADGWTDCGPSTPIIKMPSSQISSTKKFAADYLNDGSIAIVLNAAESYRYDEKTSFWTAHKIDMSQFRTHFSSGAHTYPLPDGCTISGPPFQIRNPKTGKDISDIGMITGVDAATANMITLRDGTVVVAGYPEGADNSGSGFFYRKASCDGFEAHDGDKDFMPGIYSRQESSPLTVQAQATSGMFSSVLDLAERYKWLVPALLFPFVLYKILRRLLRRFEAPDGVLALPPQIESVMRTLFYGVILAAIIYMIWPTHIQPAINSDDGSKLGTVPCYYVGEWVSTSSSGGIVKFTLTDDGRFTAGKVISKVYTGTWSVRDDKMYWNHDDKTAFEGRPDINPISDISKNAFTLTELDGEKIRFKRLEAVNSTTCGS
jgi:hypothetical protein